MLVIPEQLQRLSEFVRELQPCLSRKVLLEGCCAGYHYEGLREGIGFGWRSFHLQSQGMVWNLVEQHFWSQDSFLIKNLSIYSIGHLLSSKQMQFSSIGPSRSGDCHSQSLLPSQTHPICIPELTWPPLAGYPKWEVKLMSSFIKEINVRKKPI